VGSGKRAGGSGHSVVGLELKPFHPFLLSASLHLALVVSCRRYFLARVRAETSLVSKRRSRHGVVTTDEGARPQRLLLAQGRGR